MNENKTPSPTIIDAWLAGNLPPAEADSVEQYFTNNTVSGQRESAFVETLRGLKLPPEPDPEVGRLIERMKRDLAGSE